MGTFPPFLLANILAFGSEIYIKNVLESARLRDQSAKLYPVIPPDFAINYVFGQLIAERFNLTLITNDHPLFKATSKQGRTCGSLVMTPFPQLVFPVHVFGGIQNIENLQNCFKGPTENSHKVEGHPIFVRKENLLYNFAYCFEPKKQYESNWNFKIFTDPFDIRIWFSISTLLLLVSIVVSITTRQDFCTTFLCSLAALLDNEIRHLKNSKLYILWLFTTLLIVDLYSGAITSQVIAPPEYSRLTKFSQLEANNFSMILPHQSVHNSVSAAARVMRNFSGTTENVKILERLLPGSKVITRKDGDSFYKSLTGSKNVAALAGSNYAVWYATTGTRLVAQGGSANHRGKRCHVGEELVNVIGARFIVLIPPGSTLMAKVFQRLIAAGIIPRWDQEGNWLMYADRVQDRAKIISKIKFAKEVTTVKTLSMDGKIITVFLLWILCVTACCTTLAFEMVSRCVKESRIEIEKKAFAA